VHALGRVRTDRFGRLLVIERDSVRDR
jgi:hypothetical protein